MKLFLLLSFFFSRVSSFSPVPGSENPDLSDTVQIKNSIQLSQQHTLDFELDSSVFYATRALELSIQLFPYIGVETDNLLENRITALVIQSYVSYARAIREINLNAAEDSLKVGLKIIGENGNTSEKAALYSGLGSIYDRKGQNEKALQYYKDALELYQKSGERENYLHQLINIGIVLRVMGKYGESLEYLMEALKTGRQANDTSAIVESLLAMGFIYAFVEKYEDALRCQQEALEIYKQSNDLWGIARIHNDMGVTYSIAGELDSALSQHQAALKIRLKLNDNYNTFASFLYLGEIFAEKGNISNAIEHFENAIIYGANAAYKTMVVDAHLNLGRYYYILSNEEKSINHLKNALQLSQETADPSGQSRAAIELAKMHLIRNEPANALALLKRAEALAPNATLQYRRNIYKDIAEVYYKLGNFRSAYLNSLIYSDVKDSVNSAENLGKITRLTNVLEFENELALKKESNERMMAIKEAEINRERFTRNIFLSGMILAVVLVVIIFIRFIEKKKLSKKLNETLENLRETQTQLLHAEKMASLGELTAGIAHEIQNPLNFVNNFSEVSNELLAEMKEELNAGNQHVVIELANDIRQNLEKINYHGKRADAIVKGMLLHSRKNTGQKEPTDINALAEEYLRLSYHGLRARDKSFNAVFESEFDPSLPKIEVVAQDIGRVLLNLINNAFYAVHEKLRTVSDSSVVKTQRIASLHGLAYNPTVKVSTKNLGNKIEISVKDNGIGIPHEIKNKIFQPFFTTKPTGEGTGLGLSLSYDIIKVHGGELKVISKVGEGTEFMIILSK